MKKKAIVRGELINGQLFSIMVERIKSGKYPPTTRLPSEHEMARMFDVSHNTANKVLKQLESAGYVSMRRGIGTFVNTLSTGYDLKFIQSFRDWCVSQGHAPQTEVLVCREAQDSDVQKFIFLFSSEQLSPGNFIYLERLRCLDGRPVILEKRFLSRDFFSLKDHEALAGSYMELTRMIKRIKIHESRRKLKVVTTPSSVAAHLDLKPGSKTIEITGKTTNESGAVVDFDNLYYHPDCFEFVYTVGVQA